MGGTVCWQGSGLAVYTVFIVSKQKKVRTGHKTSTLGSPLVTNLLWQVSTFKGFITFPDNAQQRFKDVMNVSGGGAMSQSL